MSLSRLAPIERSSLGPQEPYNGCLDIFESLQRKTLAADEPFFSACHQVLHIEHAYFKRWSCLTGLAGDGLENWLNIVMIRDILWTLLEELDALSASILHLGGLDTSGLRLADKGEPTAHLRRVSVLNDNLAGLLPVGLRKGFTDETRLLRLSNISKAEDVENLEALWVIGSAIADDQFVLDVDFRRHVLQLELEQRPGGRKKTKHLYAPAIRSVDIRKPVAIDNEKQLQKRGCRLSRFLVYFRDSPQRAFLEYKYYPSDHAEASQEWTIFDRVQHLAAMLYAPKPSRLRVLQCMGVFEEPEKCRYGLLYRLPPGSHQHLGPETLLYHLNSRWTPSLTDRIALATSLAYSILNLHSVGWLHKNFRSENILFFPMENSTLRTLKAPYLVGFDSSRPDSKDQVSEELLSDPEADMYRHPDYQMPPRLTFTKLMDYYSLGIVLVEIARWRPVRHVLERRVHVDEVTTPDSQKLRQNIREILLDDEAAENYPKDIEFRMGNIYANVVSLCLSGDFGVPEDNSQEMEEIFFNKVIRPLETCVI